MVTTTEAVALPFDEAIKFFAQKTNITTQHWTDVWRDGHSRGFMVAGASSKALVQDFRDEITRALADGTTLADFRKGFDGIVEKHGWAYNGAPAWRTQIIYETNLSTAYSAGRYAQLTEPDTLATFPYWQYEHSGSSHPRLNHLAWNGTVLRADDPWWSTHYPPNGWRCGCRVRPVSRRDLARQGKDGPDRAPPLEARPWTNPRTGEVHQVPKGIDPGFDYNPGAAWKGGKVSLPADAVAPLAAAPPARSLPPVPALPATATVTPRPFQPRPFESVQEADAHLTAAARPWAGGLSPAEQLAIDDFKGAGARAINAVLRGEVVAPELRAAADTIAGAVARASAPDNLLLFRGVQGRELEALAKLRPGETWQPKGFTSTSLDPAVASRIAPGGRVVEVRVRQGQPGAAYIHPFPKYRYRQYEMLLNRQARFVVAESSADRLILEMIDGG